MDSILTTGSRLTRSLMRLPFRVRRWARLRTLWPKAEDLDRMSPEERDRYFRSIGLYERSEAALAEYREAQDQRRLGSRVHASETGDPGRREAPSS
jgi:hypothetical protein